MAQQRNRTQIVDSDTKPDVVTGTTATLSHRYTSVESMKMRVLRYVLDTQLQECDAKWSIFFTAAQSVHYEDNLQPTPPMFYSPATGLCMGDLLLCIAEVPRLDALLQILMQPELGTIAPEVLNLLHWVLVAMPQPEMRTISIYEFAEVIQTLQLALNFVVPTHVFAIGYTEYFPPPSRGEALGLSVRYGFYATTFEQIFAFVNRNAHQQLSTDDSVPSLRVFWELNDALIVSKPIPGWGHSICGSMVSCIVMCEIAMDPLGLTEYMDGVLVQRVDLLSPYLLLFYGSSSEFLTPGESPQKESSIVRYIRRHGYMTLMGTFTLLLVAIRFYAKSNSTPGPSSFFKGYLKYMVSTFRGCWTGFLKVRPSQWLGAHAG